MEASFDEELRKRGHHVDWPDEGPHYEYKDQSDYKIHVHVRNQNTRAIKICRCKYLIGSDGAASVAKGVAGIKSSKHDSHEHWAVADVRTDTKFPDFRRRECHSDQNVQHHADSKPEQHGSYLHASESRQLGRIVDKHLRVSFSFRQVSHEQYDFTRHHRKKPVRYSTPIHQDHQRGRLDQSLISCQAHH